MRKKCRQINFRVSETEYLLLEKKRNLARMNMSNFLLHCGLNKEIAVVDGLKEFAAELRKIGVNLNQLTKLCNEGRLECADLAEVKEALKEIWQLLNSLTRKVV